VWDSGLQLKSTGGRLTFSSTGSPSTAQFVGWYSSCPDTRDERRDDGVSVPAALMAAPSSLSLSGTRRDAIVRMQSLVLKSA
jgi:hypothetical protein